MRSNMDAQSTLSMNSKLPFSFKSAMEQIEEDIMNLEYEVSNSKLEVGILKSELNTIADVA